MRKILLLLAGLSVAGSASALPATADLTGQIIETTIGQLHPTQATLGYRELDYKLNRYQQQPRKLFDDFCESAGQRSVADYSPASRIDQPASFSCKAAVGSEPSAMKTVVVAPDNRYYLTDGHHTFSNFSQLSGDQVKVHVRVDKDYRKLSGMAEFWQVMKANHLVWLKTASGEIKPQQLPEKLGRATMQNDEYRSLVYFARDIGYSKPAHPPAFLEFYWGEWLAKNIPSSALNLTSRSGYADAVETVAEKMTALDPETVIAQSDTGPLTAKQLGAASRVNQKKLKKLLSATGKLSYAFMQ